MDQKLRKKTVVGQYVAAEYDGRNYSGIHVVGDRVVIMPDYAAEVVNGVYVTEQKQEQVTTAAESGVIIGIGDAAFMWTFDRSHLWPEGVRKPKVGDRVMFERYAGMLLVGNDGHLYRVMDDKCVAGIEVESPRRPEVEKDARADIGALAAAALRPIEVEQVGPAEPVGAMVEESVARDAAGGVFAPAVQDAAAAICVSSAADREIVAMVIKTHDYLARIARENPAANLPALVDKSAALLRHLGRDQVERIVREELRK